jgi:ADP-ribose pyrophosphatase YjhB (NUDIX family)
LTHKGKILLVKGWLGDGSWSLPGGGLHKNETFMNGAIREINEELSLKLSENQLRLLGEIKVFKNNYYVKLVVFKCALERLPTINVRKTEIAEITWANKADLNILPLTISTRAILARWSKQR